MTIQRAIERIEAEKVSHFWGKMLLCKDWVLQILREEAEREVVSVEKCKQAVAALYTNWESYEKRVPNHDEIIKAVLDAAGVKYKE